MSLSEVSDPCVETTLRGHRQAINCLSFSSDGKRLVSGSDDNNVMLWSLDEKQSICYRLVGHTNAVLSVAFANDYLLSASKDCSVRLWRMNKLNERCPENESVCYRCHSSSIRCVDVNADSSQFCTASDDKTVKIWSPVATNKFIQTLAGVHTNWVRHAKYSRLNPHLIGSCGDDGLICIWDTRSKEAVIQLTSRRKTTHFVSLEWHPNCEPIISSSSADTSIRIWDLRKEKMIQYYAAHTGSVNATAFHSSGNYLLSASSDETSKIFDLLEGRGLFTLKAHNGAVNCCSFTTDGQYFATAGYDKQILIWKSNLINEWDDTSDIVEIDEYVNEPFVERKKSVANSESTPKPTHFETPVTTTGNRAPLKSALRRSQSEEIKTTCCETKRGDPIRKGMVSSGDHSDKPNLSENIITQLSTLTNSVLIIEQRLSALEDRFEAHCTADNDY